MDAKRLDWKATVVGLVALPTLLFSAAAVAGAQQSARAGAWAVSPQPNRARRGVEVRPPAASPTLPNAMLLPAQPIAFNLVPSVLMSDGTVWANFGFGFEPVVRSCWGVTGLGGGSGVVMGQPTVISGNGAIISQPSRPAYTQPVPVQKTASQQMLAGTQVGGGMPQPIGSGARLSCFGTDAAGRVFVHRF